MGKYINQINDVILPTSASGKAERLKMIGSEEVDGTEYHPNLVCVVDNGFFGAAAWCYNEKEYNSFNNINDRRNKRWFIVDDVENLIDQ